MKRLSSLVVACLSAFALLLVVLVPSEAAKTPPSARTAPGPTAVIQGSAGVTAAERRESRRLDRARARATRHVGRQRLSDRGAVKRLEDDVPQLMGRRLVPRLSDTDAEVDRYLGDNQAVLDFGKHKAVAQSSLPLVMRPDGKTSGPRRRVDADLAAEDDALEPENTPSEFQIAKETGSANDLPENATLFFPNAKFGIAAAGDARNSSSAVVKDDKAIFPNVGIDTDLVVASQPVTTQAFYVLRSSASPESLAFRVTGRGAIKLKKHHLGLGTEVWRGKDLLGRIQSPVAFDSNGLRLDVDWDVQGRKIQMRVHHQQNQDVAYPVVLDPYVAEDQRHWVSNGNAMDTTGWTWWSSDNGGDLYPHVKGEGFFGYGLTIYQLANRAYAGGSWGQWYFRAAGSGVYPNDRAHIFKADYGYTAHLRSGGVGSCQRQQLWSDQYGLEQAYWRLAPGQPGGGGAWTYYGADAFTSCAAEGTWLDPTTYRYRVHCMTAGCGDDGGDPTKGTPGNAAGIVMFGGGGTPTSNGLVYLGSSLIFQSEQAPPRVTTNVPTAWAHDPPASVTVTAGDYGLGMKSLQVTGNFGAGAATGGTPYCLSAPNASSGTNPNNNGGNKGDRRFRCPETMQAVLNTSGATEGSKISVVSRDIMDNPADPQIDLKIDRTAPAVSETRGGEVIRPTSTDAAARKTVVLNASDAKSGVKTVSVSVDGGTPLSVPQPSCTAMQCPTSHQVTVPTSELQKLSNGFHVVRVSVTDQVGAPAVDHVTTQTFPITVVQSAGATPPPGGTFARTAEPILGFEDWLTYDSTDTGAGSTQRVNLANGNSIWSVTPVSNPGIGFDTVMRLTYNSLEPSGLVPGLLGANGALGYGVAGRGVSVQLGSITRLNEPLWMEGTAGLPSTVSDGTDVNRIVLTDGDGTRHSFKRDTNSAGVRFLKPAGVHLELRRYSTDTNSPRFWAATRPDGSTFFFYRDGRASESEDRHGNVLRLVYEERPDFNDLLRRLRPGCGYTLECRYRVKEVVDAAGLNPTGLQGVTQTQPTAQNERKWLLSYDDQAGSGDTVYDTMRLVAVEDRKRIGTQRRKTTLAYDASNRLTGLTVASNAPVAEQRRSWTLGWLSDTGFLSSITDPRGNATRIDNGAPQGSGLPLSSVLDPLLGWVGLLQDVRQVKGVADRESVNSGGVESRERRYRYETPTGTAPNQTFTTWVRSARKISSRFTMDGSGRLTRLVEDVDDPGRDDDSPPTGTQAQQLGSVQTWNNAVNAVASSTIGIKGALDPYDTSEAVTTQYSWGPLGQLTEEREFKGTLGNSPGGVDERTRSWEYSSHNGPLDAAASDAGREFVYDLTVQTDREGKPTKYRYLPGERGDIDEIDKPGGIMTPGQNYGLFDEKFTYDAAGRGLITKRQTRQWDDTDSRKDWAKPDSSIGDANGEAVVVAEDFAEFDANGDARLRIDPRQQTWRTRYDEVGNTTRVGDPRAGTTIDAAAAPEQPLASSGSPAGNIPADVTARGNGRSTGDPYVARFTYDALDRQVAQAIPKRSASTGTERFRVTATTFDKNDNTLQQRDAMEQVTSRSFTKTDEVAEEQEPTAPTHAETTSPTSDGWSSGAARAPITRYAYDADDNLIRRKDPVPTADQAIETAGYRTEWRLDRLGRAVAQTREGADDSAGQRKTISRAYDRRDNVIGEVDAKTNGTDDAATAAANALNTEKRRYTFVYDPFDRKKEQIENPRANPTAGATDVNRKTTWVLDKEDREKELTTPGGRVTKRTYDDRGQLIQLEEPFGYNATTKSTESWATTTINRRRDGQVTEVVSPRGNDSSDPAHSSSAFRTRLRYYDTGELYRRWIPRAKDQYGPDWEVRYGINEVGDPTSVRDPRNNLIGNTFLDTGELRTTNRPGWWFYDEQNAQIRERTAEDPAPQDATSSRNGLPKEPGNGDFGKVDPQSLPDALPLAGATEVDYNARLQPTAIYGVNDAGTPNAIKQDFAYDNLGRLEKRTIPKDPGSAQTASIQLEWHYDVRGNVRAKRQLRLVPKADNTLTDDSAVTTWRYDAFDRLTSTTEPPSCRGTGCLAPVTGQTWDRNDNVIGMTMPTQANNPTGGVGTTTGTKTLTPDAADRIYDVVDEAGARTRETFDLDDNVTTRYAPRAFPTPSTLTSTPNQAYATEFRYDGANRQTWARATVTDDAGGTELLTETTYDREGNPREQKTPGSRKASGSGSIPQRVTQRLYDARNLLWKETLASGTDDAATTVTEYDGLRNLRRTVRPKGVTGDGTGATVAADTGGDGTTGDTAKNATVLTYNPDGLATKRVLPWNDSDGARRYAQDYERTPRGLVSRITDVYRDDQQEAASRYSTKIDRNLAGWPTKSTEQRVTGVTSTGTTWENAPNTDPLRYEYDQHGNQTLWSSDGGSRTIQRSFYRSGQLNVKCGRRTSGGSQEQVYSYRYDTSGGLRQIIDWMHYTAPTGPESCQPAEQDDKPDGGLGVRSTHVARDRAGRPVNVQERWVGGKETTLQYVPSTPNLVQSAQTNRERNNTTGTYSGGTGIRYEYDEQDRNTAVKVNNDGSIPSSSPNRETTMKWWPSGQRRETLKPAVSGNRTKEERFYDARGQLSIRGIDPASTSAGQTNHVYAYDKHGNRMRDERTAVADPESDNPDVQTPIAYNARDQLTKWVRKRDGSGDTTERDPFKKTEWTDIDGAGRPIQIKETITVPQGTAQVKTVIDTTNTYRGERLEKSARSTVASGTGVTTSTSEQLDCFAYNVFGSQTQTHRQTSTSSAPTACKNGSDEWLGTLETRNVFDTFERHTAGKQRQHDKPGGEDAGSMNGTQAFCYDPFDRRDRRVEGLTGAADPADTGNETEGRTRAQTACTTAAGSLGGAAAYDYSYFALTEQLTRETRSGREQTYEYTASGERLGRLKKTGTTTPTYEWRPYDTDAQGSVVGLESATDGTVAAADRYDTDPYGAPVAKDTLLSPEAQENPFRFQGFYRDQDTGTYDMQARTYRPETGRFLQQDRFENPQADLTLASDPLTNSRYAFTAGNPSSRAEYDGHFYDNPLIPEKEDYQPPWARDPNGRGTPVTTPGPRPTNEVRPTWTPGSSGDVRAPTPGARPGSPGAAPFKRVYVAPPSAKASAGTSTSFFKNPQGAVREASIEAGRGTADVAKESVEFLRDVADDPVDTLAAAALGASSFVGPNASEAWINLIHAQCDDVSAVRCGTRLTLGLAGGKGITAGVSAARTTAARGVSAARLGRGYPAFTQTTAGGKFKNGPFAGRTIGDVSAGLRSGQISPEQLPVEVIRRGGETLALNTRSSLALRRGGVRRSDWTLRDVTGDPAAEEVLTQRLLHNKMSGGSDVIRITGAGGRASSLR